MGYIGRRLGGGWGNGDVERPEAITDLISGFLEENGIG